MLTSHKDVICEEPIKVELWGNNLESNNVTTEVYQKEESNFSETDVTSHQTLPDLIPVHDQESTEQKELFKESGLEFEYCETNPKEAKSQSKCPIDYEISVSENSSDQKDNGKETPRSNGQDGSFQNESLSLKKQLRFVLWEGRLLHELQPFTGFNGRPRKVPIVPKKAKIKSILRPIGCDEAVVYKVNYQEAVKLKGEKKTRKRKKKYYYSCAKDRLFRRDWERALDGLAAVAPVSVNKSNLIGMYNVSSF